jgi:hypothetical protein
VKICTIHFLRLLSADHRPSEVADATKALNQFTSNAIVTAMDNYGFGKAITERVELMERRADTDKVGDSAMHRCMEAASVVANGKVSEPPEYPYPVCLGRPEHPEINKKSWFSADR